MPEPAPEVRRKIYPRNLNPARLIRGRTIQKKFIRKSAEREKIRANVAEREAPRPLPRLANKLNGGI